MGDRHQKLAKRIEKNYANASIEDTLRALQTDIFKDRIALVSSFGSEAAILLYYAAQVDPHFPVIFLDTKKLFPETLEYRDNLIEKLGLTNVKTIYPEYADLTRNDPHGDLWRRDSKTCCTIRKVIPLQKALKGYDAWITGRKRYHGGIRTSLPFVEVSDGRVKINPLLNWTEENISAFFEKTGLPRHPLAAEGFTSIGCIPCTDKPSDKNDVRSGRWKGQEKEECGIHLGEDGVFYRILPEGD